MIGSLLTGCVTTVNVGVVVVVVTAIVVDDNAVVVVAVVVVFAVVAAVAVASVGARVLERPSDGDLLALASRPVPLLLLLLLLPVKPAIKLLVVA